MKYYEFPPEIDWDEMERKVEEADNNEEDDTCWDLETEMTDSVICGGQTPKEVDGINEKVDGLYMEDGDEEAGDVVGCYVVHNNYLMYAFRYRL